ncbi:MAG: glycosyltransferase family 2 protein [Betaproteobacteria bacterium]
MRIVGFTLARNEEDVIEASIRHNLRSLDALTVVDHGSDDATPAILAALVREGLPLEVLRDDTPEMRQSDVTTAHARRLLREGADLCIPIDADEFLRMPSREAFERVVSATDPAVHLVMPWLTYLPALDAPGDLVARLEHARRKIDERHGFYKVIVRRALLDTPDAAVGNGNHHVKVRGQTHLAHEALHGSVAALAHVPVRSAGQFTSKVAVGWLAVRLADEDEARIAFHWHEEFLGLLAGRPITHDRLASIVANYSVGTAERVDPAQVRWLEDPFLGDIALRYTPSRPPNPLARILTFGERVAAEVARATGGL